MTTRTDAVQYSGVPHFANVSAGLARNPYRTSIKVMRPVLYPRSRWVNNAYQQGSRLDTVGHTIIALPNAMAPAVRRPGLVLFPNKSSPRNLFPGIVQWRRPHIGW